MLAGVGNAQDVFLTCFVYSARGHNSIIRAVELLVILDPLRPPFNLPPPHLFSLLRFTPIILGARPPPSFSDRPLIHHPLLVRAQNALKDKIGLGKGESGNDRKSQIKKELDEIRSQQSDNKLNREKVFEQLKALQDGIQKKVD